MPHKGKVGRSQDKRLELLQEIGRKKREQSGQCDAGGPSWRRIEMLRERKALLDALDDPLLGFVEPEETVFLAESAQAGRYYTRVNTPLDGESELDDETDPDQD